VPLAEALPALIRVPVLNGKRLELLKETIPGIARVAFLWDPSMDPAPRRAIEVAARSLVDIHCVSYFPVQKGSVTSACPRQGRFPIRAGPTISWFSPLDHR